MTLNKNSNLSRLYRWFYDKPTMPSNLCPYFWSLVIMVFAIIPWCLIITPYLMCRAFGGYKYASNKEKSAISIFLYMFSFFVVCMIITIPALFMVLPKWLFKLGMTGVLAWILLILFGVCKGVVALWGKIKTKKLETDYLTEEKPSIIVEFVKATYGRYCPKIDWE